MNTRTNTQANVASPARGKLHELEGLRGWLCLWVVLGHMVIESGWQATWLPSAAKIFMSPSLAVQVFIILSGFVITYTLDTTKPNYKTFITQRALRLFPLYYFCLAIGVISLPWLLSFYPEYLKAIGSPEGLVEISKSWSLHQDNRFAYLGACLVGLHGCIPNTLLPHAFNAYVSQAWSISLEWQFYLLAPLLLKSLSSIRNSILLTLFLFITVGFRDSLDIGGWGAFFPSRCEYFLVGILSYYAYKHLPGLEKVDFYNRALLGGVALSLSLCGIYSTMAFHPWPFTMPLDSWFPTSLWFMVLLLIIARKNEPDTALTRTLSFIFSNRIILHLGRSSYSIYLGHYFVIFLLQFLILRFLPAHLNKWHILFIFCTVGLPLTFLLSSLSYSFIEKPGIRLGKWLTSSPNK